MKYFLLTFAILSGSNAVGSILIPFSPYLGVGAGVIFAGALMELVGYSRGAIEQILERDIRLETEK